jgi:predicted aspartyl protease
MESINSRSRTKMARIIKTIEIEGQQALALFDTGVTYSYIRSPLVRAAPRRSVTRPARVTLGGKDIDIRELCLIEGKIEGLDFFTDAVAVEEIGHADGHELDALIGARTMEQWEIRLDPKTGALDLEGLRRREFTEFLSGTEE